jgi:hypothetical protein
MTNSTTLYGSSKMIGTVVTYEHKGMPGPCGQTVGADGSGTYAVVFTGETVEETDFAASMYIKKYLQQAYIRNIHFVSASEGYYCIPLQVIEVKHETDG